MSDPLYDEAIWIVASDGLPTVGHLVERLSVSGERAAALLEAMSHDLILAPTEAGGEPLILAGSYEGIRRMVEATWSQCFEVMGHAVAAADRQGAERQVCALWDHFERERAKATAVLPPKLARAHRMVAERERERQFQEWKAQRRAGNEGAAVRPVEVRAPSAFHGLGGVAARTVVRATIWESIFSIFR